jgi:hypothetical protein
MKNWDNLVVTDKFNITGSASHSLHTQSRGTVFIVDFIKSGFFTEIWVKELPKIDVGDTILYDGVTYTIKGLDIHRNTFNGGLMTQIGVLV